MDQMRLLQERANDSLVQSRCDRRSLATLAKWLHEHGAIVTSTSQLVRVIIEECRQRVVAEDAVDILSYEDADSILKALGVKSLNTNSRQMSTYIKQQGKEAI